MAQVKPATEEVSAELSSIYEAYHGKVLAYATRLLGRAEADDIAQDVFIKVGRSLGDLEDRSKLASWIYAITLNTVRDAARRRGAAPECLAATVRPVPDTEEGPLLERVPDTTSRTPEETLVRKEMVACYLDYVRQLPRAHYLAYVLSEFEELPDEAIAGRLSVSLSTVKIRLHRARARLHEQLRRECRCYRNARGELIGEPKR